LVGIPPTVGFRDKLTLFLTTMQAGYLCLTLLAAANTNASLFYFARVMGIMYFGTPPDEVGVLDRFSGIAMWTAAILIVSGTVHAQFALAAFRLSTLLMV
jgi:NADH-quinone oxidoreductase subunit N